jgi:hypothetical protein
MHCFIYYSYGVSMDGISQWICLMSKSEIIASSCNNL